MPRGGGQEAVLAVPELPRPARRDRPPAAAITAVLVSSLRGDVPDRRGHETSRRPDLDVVAETCRVGSSARRVHGGQTSGRGTGGAGVPCTAIRASAEHVFGSPNLDGRSGGWCRAPAAVGRDLARATPSQPEGAEVLVADVDEVRGSTRRERKPAAGMIFRGRCVDDGVRRLLHPVRSAARSARRRSPALGCRIVAGSANNQLADPPRTPVRLHARNDPLRHPTYVIQCGRRSAVARLAGRWAWDEAELERSFAGIGPARWRTILPRRGHTWDHAGRGLRNRPRGRARSRRAQPTR